MHASILRTVCCIVVRSDLTVVSDWMDANSSILCSRNCFDSTFGASKVFTCVCAHLTA